MRRMLLVSLVLSAAMAGSALAQNFSSVEERMTEAEFKAAGLDKLSPEELAALNAFIAAETGKVASTLPAATPVADNRGFNNRTGPDGAPKRVKASTRSIRAGLVVKPVKRKYAYTRRVKNGEKVLTIPKVEIAPSCPLLHPQQLQLQQPLAINAPTPRPAPSSPCRHQMPTTSTTPPPPTRA